MPGGKTEHLLIWSALARVGDDRSSEKGGRPPDHRLVEGRDQAAQTTDLRQAKYGGTPLRRRRHGRNASSSEPRAGPDLALKMLALLS